MFFKILVWVWVFLYLSNKNGGRSVLEENVRMF